MKTKKLLAKELKVKITTNLDYSQCLVPNRAERKERMSNFECDLPSSFDCYVSSRRRKTFWTNKIV